MSRMPMVVLGVLLVVMVFSPFATGASGSAQSWDFSVMLDGDKIGYHRFELIDEGDGRRLTSEARFDVRFLFVNAYRYRHSTTELWSDGCLRDVDARTQANGKKMDVRGTTIGDRLIIDAGEATHEIDDCVMTFAYWNPSFLHQPRLLNVQSGEYLDVQVEELGREPVTVRGRDIEASVYKLTAKEIELKLWYSSNSEWLALESVAKGGRIVRYELT